MQTRRLHVLTVVALLISATLLVLFFAPISGARISQVNLGGVIMHLHYGPEDDEDYGNGEETVLIPYSDGPTFLADDESIEE